VGTFALCKIIGLEKSTHQVQFMPVEEALEEMIEPKKEKVEDVYDDPFAMAKLGLDDDDKKKFSF